MRLFWRKFRFSWRLLVAFASKHKKILFFSCFFTVLALIILSYLFTLTTQKKNIRIGLVGKYTPNSLPLAIQNLISDGLTEIDASGQVLPKLVENWESEQDGQVYLFHLQKNLFWQDKTAFKAQDIVYPFADVTTQVLDDFTLRFELKEIYSPFPSILARPVFKKGLVGTGEYRLLKMARNGQIVEKMTLVKNEKKGQEFLTFRFYPTEKTARLAFKLGEIDRLEQVSDPGELKNWPRVKIEAKVNQQHFVALFFNTEKNFLDEKANRQALAYAIQKRWQPQALGPYNPDSWVFNPNVKRYEYDLNRAQELLTKGEDEKTSQLTQMELATVPALLNVAEMIKNDWQALGIETQIKVIASLSENYDAVLLNQESPLDPDQYVFWHSTQVKAANISRYKSPKLDKLLEDGRKTFDQAARKQIYFDFQRFLLEDCPAVFLYHPTLYTLARI